MIDAVLKFISIDFHVVFPGFFSSLSHAVFLLRSYMFDVSTGTLVVLCRKYLCLGSVCLAYR